MSKISELSDGGVIQGGDTLIAVRSGGNVKVTYGGSTTANIDGGTIDGTVIGGSTAAAGTFTTVTADGLNVGDQPSEHLIQAYDSSGSTPISFGLGEQPNTSRAMRLEKVDNNDADPYATNFYFSDHPTTKAGSLNFYSSQDKLNILRLDSNGDVSLFEDTGTSPKFFWDASAESLTVGNSSGLTNTAGFSNTLGVKGFLPSITIEDTGTGTGKYTFGVTSGNFGLWDSTRNAYLLYGNSAGNLLVGRTSSGTLTVAGSEFQASGAGFHIRDGGTALYVGRKTSDGNLVEFSKDGTAVGSIGTAGGDFVINGTTLGLLATAGSGNFGWNSSIFYPTADNARDLGTASFRFDDVYATNGTIQTSDRNEKQDIEELSEAEQRVAVAAKGLLRKFRWKDSVEEKGDDARVHFGIIAQDLQAAFEAEGLDAGRYAMFISSTWTDEETGEERSRMGVRYSELLAFIIAAI